MRVDIAFKIRRHTDTNSNSFLVLGFGSLPLFLQFTIVFAVYQCFCNLLPMCSNTHLMRGCGGLLVRTSDSGSE